MALVHNTSNKKNDLSISDTGTNNLLLSHLYFGQSFSVRTIMYPGCQIFFYIKIRTIHESRLGFTHLIYVFTWNTLNSEDWTKNSAVCTRTTEVLKKVKNSMPSRCSSAAKIWTKWTVGSCAKFRPRVMSFSLFSGLSYQSSDPDRLIQEWSNRKQDLQTAAIRIN